MQRRRYLAAVGGLAGLAGCLSDRGADRPADGTPTDAAGTPTATPERLAARGEPSGVCSLAVRDVGIEAVVAPRTAADWSGLDSRTLVADTTVVGVVRDGRARAYPIRAFFHNEVVNDDLGGPLLVTFCPLCSSGLVAERLVDGAPALFGVSGHLWTPPGPTGERTATPDDAAGPAFGVSQPDPDAAAERDPNLVMYDAATGSYWSQLLGRAICGPATGATLAPVSAETTTWGDWRAAHPETDVLLPPPRSAARNPPYPGEGPPG